MGAIPRSPLGATEHGSVSAGGTVPASQPHARRVAVTDLATLEEKGCVRVRVGDVRLLILRSGDRISAVQDACPHAGYSLREGEVRGDLLTCHFHNWKFRLSDGACVLGDGDLRTYPVTVQADDQVVVDLGAATASEEHYRLRVQLRRSWRRGATGQLSRDVVTLLRHGALAHDLIADALTAAVVRSEHGWGHEHSAAADCAAMVRSDMGTAAAYPVVRALAGLSAPDRDPSKHTSPRTPGSVPTLGRLGHRLVELIEEEALDEARALVASIAPWQLTEVRRALVTAAADHHLSGGHVVVHLAKAFSWMDTARPTFAVEVLPALVTTVIRGAREDKLPYLRGYVDIVTVADCAACATCPTVPDWNDHAHLRDVILGSDPRALARCVLTSLTAGAGVERLLDVASTVASELLLGYRAHNDLDPTGAIDWMDLTHPFALVNAVRELRRREPAPPTVRLAALALFEVHRAARKARGCGGGSDPIAAPMLEAADTFEDAVRHQRGDDAAAHMARLPVADAAVRLQWACLRDGVASPRSHHHLLETVRAAVGEARALGSSLPLAAAARFVAGPRLEVHVARQIRWALEHQT